MTNGFRYERIGKNRNARIMPTTTEQKPALVLRDYQEKAIQEAREVYKAGAQRVLLAAPTGSGKTKMFCFIVQSAVGKGKKVLIVVHRKILLSQTAQELKSFGIPYGFIAGGHEEDRSKPVQIALIQTLPFRPYFQHDFAIFDEAHITSWATWSLEKFPKFKDLGDDPSWKRKQPKVLGLTATPYRLSSREEMCQVFDGIVSTPPPHVLQDKGFLVRAVYYSAPGISVKGVRITNGEYVQKELSKVCNTPRAIAFAYQKWNELARERKTVVFCVDVAHAEAVAAYFSEQGVMAKSVSGKTPDKECGKIYEQLETGEIQVLASCNKITEGFNVRSIDCVMLCVPTKSKARYIQQVGRGLRICPEVGKVDCLVIDQAGVTNEKALGKIEDIDGYSLGVEKPKKKKTQSGPSVDEGPKEKKKKGPEAVQELTLSIPRRDVPRYESYRFYLRSYYEKGLPPSAAGTMTKTMHKTSAYPPDAWKLGAVFGGKATEKEKAEFKQYLISLSERNFKLAQYLVDWYYHEMGEPWDNYPGI